MNTDDTLEEKLQQAAQAIREADGLLITAGEGRGMDSGLPDSGVNKGFGMRIPRWVSCNRDFQRSRVRRRFMKTRCWLGAFGHRLNLYRKTIPHDGFRILRELAEKLSNGAFVATSNVDGHFTEGWILRATHCRGAWFYSSYTLYGWLL